MAFSAFLGVAFLTNAITCFCNNDGSPSSKRNIFQPRATTVFAASSDLHDHWADDCCPTLGDDIDHLLAGEAASNKKLLKAKPHARVRLFCAYGVADAAVSLRSWIQEAPDWLEVRILELPGHGYLAQQQQDLLPPCSYHPQSTAYSREELRDQFNTCIVQKLADQMEPLLYQHKGEQQQEPICYAFYGFSWGAMITYEVCLELERRNHHLPVLLVAAGRGAPNVILYSDDFFQELQGYSDPELLEFVQESMGFPMDQLPSKRVARVASLFRCGMILSGVHAGTFMNNNNNNNNNGTTIPRHVWEDIQAPILRSTENVPLLHCPVVSLGASEDEIWPNQHGEFWSEVTTRKHQHVCLNDLSHEQLMNAPATKHTLFEELARVVTDKMQLLSKISERLDPTTNNGTE